MIWAIIFILLELAVLIWIKKRKKSDQLPEKSSAGKQSTDNSPGT